MTPLRRLAIAGVLLAVPTAAHLARGPRPPPAKTPAAAAEPWMADALPGIGPKRRDEAAAAIRTGKTQQLPAPAAATADRWFLPVDSPPATP